MPCGHSAFLETSCIQPAVPLKLHIAVPLQAPSSPKPLRSFHGKRLLRAAGGVSGFRLGRDGRLSAPSPVSQHLTGSLGMEFTPPSSSSPLDDIRLRVFYHRCGRLSKGCEVKFKLCSDAPGRIATVWRKMFAFLRDFQLDNRPATC